MLRLVQGHRGQLGCLPEQVASYDLSHVARGVWGARQILGCGLRRTRGIPHDNFAGRGGRQLGTALQNAHQLGKGTRVAQDPLQALQGFDGAGRDRQDVAAHLGSLLASGRGACRAGRPGGAPW